MESKLIELKKKHDTACIAYGVAEKEMVNIKKEMKTFGLTPKTIKMSIKDIEKEIQKLEEEITTEMEKADAILKEY